MTDYKTQANASRKAKMSNMGVNVTHGAAAAKEMAAMEKESDGKK